MGFLLGVLAPRGRTSRAQCLAAAARTSRASQWRNRPGLAPGSWNRATDVGVSLEDVVPYAAARSAGPERADRHNAVDLGHLVTRNDGTSCPPSGELVAAGRARTRRDATMGRR